MAEEAKVEEKGEKGLTIKLDIPRNSITEAIGDGVQMKILAGAVEYIMREMKPEMTQKFLEGVLTDAFKSFSSWKVREILDKTMAPMIEEVMRRPEVVAFVRQNVEKGINDAIATLPDTVKTKLIERAVTGMTKAWKDDR